MRKEAHIRAAAVAVLLLLFCAQASIIAMRKSNTWDEPAHILAGYSYITEGMDFLSPLNHPVLGRAINAAFPALFLDLDFDRTVKPEEAKDSDFFRYSLKFLFDNRPSADTILFLARLSNILLGAALGLYVFLWAREVWGDRGGYLSLFFYSLSPNILAHSSLATTDLPITAFFFISCYYLHRLGRDGIAWSSVFAAAFFMALAFTSKHTAFLLLPVFALSFFFGLKKEKPSRAIVAYSAMLLMAYVLIWGIYGFRYHDAGPLYQPLDWARFEKSSFNSLFTYLRSFKILPESYLYGVAGVLAGAGAGKPAFLMGAYSNTGWWYYFMIAFLIKTPVPTIILLTASALYVFSRKDERGKALVLLFPAVLVFAVFSLQKVNIGLRHILPVYPFIFTFIGFAATIRTESMRLAKGLFAFLLAWYAYGAASIFPHQLAYFNEFIGGPEKGYRYLVDSNLDWGQDLKGLKAYMDEKGIKSIKLAYFGLSDPSKYGIEYEYLPSFAILNPKGVRDEVRLNGYFAISATMLQGVYLRDRDFYRLFRETEPVDTIGYSILIYRF